MPDSQDRDPVILYLIEDEVRSIGIRPHGRIDLLPQSCRTGKVREEGDGLPEARGIGLGLIDTEPLEAVAVDRLQVERRPTPEPEPSQRSPPSALVRGCPP